MLQLENRYDFTNLKQCRFEWSLAQFPEPTSGRKGHKVIAAGLLRSPNVPPHQTGDMKLALPSSRQHADVLYLTARDPRSKEIWKWSWALKSPELTPKTSKHQLQVRENGNLLAVQNSNVALSFSKTTGVLVRATYRGRELPIGNGPRLIAYRRNDRRYDNVAGVSQLSHFETKKEDGAVVVEASYDGALKSVRWRLSSNSTTGLWAQLDYEYRFEGGIDILGVEFQSAEKSLRALRWLGMGPYRVWQNRLQGTRLDVWENAYNDSTPGESWIFPEFKGYFHDLRWARFEADSGPFAISFTAPNSYLGLFKPKDGINGLLDFPDVGIAVLDVIPAMRNKFHTTDELGPQSRPKQVSGVVKRTLQFRFGF
jgi:hypothetical protein